MTRDQKAEFAALLNATFSAYGKFTPLPQAAIELWITAMGDVPQGKIIKALNAWIAYATRCPTPADIRKAVEPRFPI